MTSQDFVKLALQMTTMLGFAVIFGEIMRRFRQPAVVGEMFGGIILGPTLFGWLAPSLYEWLFLSSANVTVVRDEAWAIAFGLNARGATGIILAGVGLANGIIDARIFVAIVVMALITSLMAGPMMSRLLWHRTAPARQGSPALDR
jgi:Kef-type K+ transport system membrane component KefB